MNGLTSGADGVPRYSLFAIRYFFCAAAFAFGFVASGRADDSVVNSKHDLSTFGPGPVRAVEETQVCIFCHAPHNTSPAAPLWNRNNPVTYYRIYQSSTLDARMDQPHGASKMCLSCHDGSVALGLVLSRPATNPIAMNQPFMPTGPSNLTNDLADDHPIGFPYDRQLSNRDRQLRPPDAISHAIKLGPRGELECIACHDPHNNELGNFLRMPEREGVLCTTCHRMAGWPAAAHRLSPRTVPQSVTGSEPLPFRSMFDNSCMACHQVHSAPEAERLLRLPPYELCISCHDGATGMNILAVIGQNSGHRVNRPFAVHDPAESPLTMAPHVSCEDCHNPHAAREAPLVLNLVRRSFGPVVPPAMDLVPGVSGAGIPIDVARFYYEVCYRCHADKPVPVPNPIPRQVDNDGNIRRQLLPTAASAHPVMFPNPNDNDVPSLLPQYRNLRFISCQDCHNNPDARELGGQQANGPHGSRYQYLLAARYDTADYSMESPQSYALCYQCHDRNSLLNNESFEFHRQHVERGRSPCAACHAPHGVTGSPSQHDHLINFDVLIVGGQRRYNDTGQFSGNCTLTCHGVNHVNFKYGPK